MNYTKAARNLRANYKDIQQIFKIIIIIKIMVTVLNSVQLINISRKMSSDLLSWSTLDNSTMARWLVSVWDIGKTKDEKRLGAPIVTPLELINRLIIMYSKVGDAVLDPFMGTGSTMVSAYMLIRKGIGFEIYKPLIDLAVKRLNEVEEMRGPQPLSLPDALTLEMDALRREVDHEPVLVMDDARNMDKYIAEESVELVLTAPPPFIFGLGGARNLDPRDIGGINDYATYLEELVKILALARRSLKKGGFMIIIIGDVNAGPTIFPLHVDLINTLKKLNLETRDIFIWDKRKDYDPKSMTGKVHEYIMIFQKT